MSEHKVVNSDLVKIFRANADGKDQVFTVLAWGDEVEVLNEGDDRIEVSIIRFREERDSSVAPARAHGFIKKKANAPASARPVLVDKDEAKILKVDFVDVQQGDGSVIETPDGKVVVIDGGDNQLFARYLANRFRGTSADAPKEVDCIIVTHGDADHFQGLSAIHDSETNKRLPNRKRLFIHPQRVYHNGLVKRPGKIGNRDRKETELLGATREVQDPETGKTVTIITGLESNLLDVDSAEMNEPFKQWKTALTTYAGRGPVEFRRLAIGDDDAFDFLTDEEISVRVLGPIPKRVGDVEGLVFLGEPPRGARVGAEVLALDDKPFKGKSASHTINGHSVIFRLTYGRCNFLFTGDLNDESGRILARAHGRGEISLQAEVFKVPHHGSADFSGAFIQSVAPVVSVVSSGDESARKEFIHPRSTLVGALGKFGRLAEPLIFITELVAFFSLEGFVDHRFHELTEAGREAIKHGEKVVDVSEEGLRFFAFSRTAFGLVSIRTDGRRMFVFTNSGQVDLKEAYAFEIDEWGEPVPAEVRIA